MAASIRVQSNASEFVKALRELQRPVAEAATAALREAATNAVNEGRRNIAGAGRFGPRWQSGLQFTITPKGEPSLQAKATIFHTMGIAAVFEFGATIHGKPLLWLPTRPGLPRPGRFGGKLVSARNRGGKTPLLFEADPSVGRRPGDKRQPLYVGVPQVTLRKRFRVLQIVQEQAARLGELFVKNWKG